MIEITNVCCQCGRPLTTGEWVLLFGLMVMGIVLAVAMLIIVIDFVYSNHLNRVKEKKAQEEELRRRR